MKHLSEEELDDLRANLAAEKDSLEEEMAEHGKSTGGSWQGSSESEGAEADATDAADNIETLATNVPLVGALQRRFQEVNKAIAKMDKGTYGICDVCKAEIPLDRLKANPAASTCIEHA